MPVIEQNFVFPSDLDPEVFGEKTKGGKKYTTVTVGAEDAGTDTNEIQFGTETKVVKNVLIDDKYAEMVFSEVLNHNQQGKRMFVCTDVLIDNLSLIHSDYEYAAGSGPSYSEGEVPPLPGGLVSLTTTPMTDNGNGYNDFVLGGFNALAPYNFPYKLRIVSNTCSIPTDLTVKGSGDVPADMVDVENVGSGTFIVSINSAPPTDELVFTFSGNENSHLPQSYGFHVISEDHKIVGTYTMGCTKPLHHEPIIEEE